MEVRCCCNPGVVLGELELALPPGHKYIRFPLKTGGTIELEIAIVNLGYGSDVSYPAFKSGHHPVETLRLIRGFKEKA